MISKFFEVTLYKINLSGREMQSQNLQPLSSPK